MSLKRGWWIDDDGYLRSPDNVTAYTIDDAVTLCDSLCRERDEAVALLDSALRTINAIATTAGYAYRAPNTFRTAALDDIRLTAGTFKGGDGHKAENFLARIDGKAGAR